MLGKCQFYLFFHKICLWIETALTKTIIENHTGILKLVFLENLFIFMQLLCMGKSVMLRTFCFSFYFWTIKLNSCFSWINALFHCYNIYFVYYIMVIISLILVFCFYRLQDADLGFVIIIDRRNDKWSSVKTVLLKISVLFCYFIYLMKKHIIKCN